MKIALITPWPPQRSGIADYAFELARGLAGRGIDVSVVTSASAPVPLDGCAISLAAGQPHIDVAPDALPIFQLGNNIDFHGFQPELLTRLGGVVQLHDLVLHHFHVARTLAAGRGSYWEDLRLWYGPDVTAKVRKLCELGAPPWTNAAAAAIPMFEPYLVHADAVIVHSHAAQSSISERIPGLRVLELPQCYPLAAPSHRPPAAKDRPLKLGVFGLIEQHKRLDVVLDALAALHSRGIALELDICGALGVNMRGVDDRIASLGLASVVRLRRQLEYQDFLAAIRNVDLCINLRDPTMGETSAVVTQALQLGTPVIVSAVGWYAELPECVLKVPSGDGATSALVAHVSRLAADRAGLKALGDATRRYAVANLNFHAVLARYADAVADLANERSRARAIDRALYADAARALGDLDLSSEGREGEIRAELLRSFAPCL